MRRTFVLGLATSLVVVRALVGCTDETIIVAGLAGDASSPVPLDATPLPTRCVANDDCPSGAFCSRTDCGARVGTCETRPFVCGGDVAPVCGCDGVTYWNDCLRRAAGVGPRATGQCPLDAAAGCDPDGMEACPSGTFCARLTADPRGCGGPGGGPPRFRATCWALPATCPADAPVGDRWIACGPGSASCEDTCNAIRTEKPHQRATTCP